MDRSQIDKAEKNNQSANRQFAAIRPAFDEGYLNDLIAKARHNWEGVDPDEWLYKIRGDYEV